MSALTPAQSTWGSSGPAPWARAVGWIRRRAWPLSLTVASIVLGMAYSLWWSGAVRHSHLHYWLVPADLWLTVRDAHLVTWGALPYLYGSQTALVTLPGLPILLAPLAGAVQLANLSESFGPWTLVHPTAWLVYGPVTLALGSSLIFVADAWVNAAGLVGWRRRMAVLAAGAVAWDMTARWGHPEDALALAAALCCLMAVKDERWVRAGWYLGLALCFQPLVILLLPILVIQAGRRHALPLLLRAAILPGGLLAVVLAVDAHDVVRSALEQPNFPLLDQPTPWSRLSPHMAAHTIGAGPSRLIALAVAWALGGLGRRWRGQWPRLLWLGSVMLATRGVFEAVMVPYYVIPALFLAVLTAWMGLPTWRALIATGAAFATIVMYSSRGPMWSWWLESCGVLLATVLASSPLLGPLRSPRPSGGGSPDRARSNFRPSAPPAIPGSYAVPSTSSTAGRLFADVATMAVGR